MVLLICGHEGDSLFWAEVSCNIYPFHLSLHLVPDVSEYFFTFRAVRSPSLSVRTGGNTLSLAP